MRSSSGRLASGIGAAARRRPCSSAGSGSTTSSVRGDQLHAVVHQVPVELAQLLVGEIEVRQAHGKLLVRQVAPLVSLRDQLPKLLRLNCSVGEKHFFSCSQRIAPVAPCPP